MSSILTGLPVRQLSRHGPAPDSYCDASISGASRLVKTPVVGRPFPPSIEMPAISAAGRASSVASLTRRSVSPIDVSEMTNWDSARNAFTLASVDMEWLPSQRGHPCL